MFFNRLLDACKLRNKALTTVLRSISCSTGMIDGWKNKGSMPRADILAKLASELQVSADYLLGLSDDPAPKGEYTPVLCDSETKLISLLRNADPELRNILTRMLFAGLNSAPNHNFFSASKRVYLPDTPPELLPFKPKSINTVPKRILGPAAAGLPLEAISDLDDDSVNIPARFDGDNYVAIRANGNSMIGVGIHDGDICIFQTDACFENGQIWWVQFDDDGDYSGAIKRVYRRNGEYEFRSENPDFTPFTRPAKTVRLMGLFRYVDHAQD